MKDKNNVLMIPKIELGIVIDHIPAGKGIKILEIITQYEALQGVPVSLGLNYKSQKLGQKDLIKLQLEFLAPEIIQQISIVVPGVTVKAIKNFGVHNKVIVQPPNEVKNLLACKNPNCVTNTERNIESHFLAVEKGVAKLKCSYCERIFNLNELHSLVE
jgi:aspartate carbamoyltransferase regulatory subunit